MSDDKLHNEITRANRAKELLNDELLVNAFKTLEDAYISMWRSTSPDQGDAREKLYLAINVIGKFRDHLTAIISNGTIATAELNKLIEEAERKKRFRII